MQSWQIYACILITLMLAVPYSYAYVTEESGDIFEVFSVEKVIESVDKTSQKVFLINDSGKLETVTHEKVQNNWYKKGDEVVLRTQVIGDRHISYIADAYRQNHQWWFFIGFILLAFLSIGKRAFFAFLSLFVSGLILIYFIAPNILAGFDPLMISFIGSIGISAASMYISHGISYKTTIAFISMIVTLLIVFFVGRFYVHTAFLFGLGTEDAGSLFIQSDEMIDMSGVFLSGVIISTLGVLDDVTITQVTFLEELHKANKKYGMKELFDRAANIGREHMISMVNTLVLAYVGVSFPVFLLLVSQTDVPMWVFINSEYFAEEIARSLLGSFALLLAIPLTNLLGSWFYSIPEKERQGLSFR